MKRFNWLLISVIVVSLAVLPLAGCVSKSEYEALQAEHTTVVQEKASLTQESTSLKAELQRVQSDLTNAQADYDALKADHDELNANYEAVSKELAEIKEVYPLGEFSSPSELQEWVQLHVIEYPAQSAPEWYRAALKQQEQAMRDGYMVSTAITASPEDPELYIVWCTAFANGDLYWWYPDEGAVHLSFTKYELEL